MSGIIGRSRSSIDIRNNPALNGQVITAVGADMPLEVLEDQGNWLKIKPLGLKGVVAGYVQRLAVSLPGLEIQLFPILPAPSGYEAIPAVPRSLKAAELTAWLEAGGQPGWVRADYWEQLDADQQQTILDNIRLAIQQHQAEWDQWLNEIKASGRQEEASLDEWLTILEGGRNVLGIRSERIFAEASQASVNVGWINVDDIMLWSGHIKLDAQKKIWHEVSLYKFNKELHGWFRGELIDEYIFPNQDNDPSVASNAQNVFDLSQPLVRIPADPEIDQALALKSAAQYIDIKSVVGSTKRHFNLCGEFCVASLLGSDIMPVLMSWKAKEPHALPILNNVNRGTTPSELLTLLNLYGWNGVPYQYSSTVTPTSPKRLKDLLLSGKKVISGVTITPGGKVSIKGGICHWVILEDAIPVGNDGWIRLYNPFMNREEVYTFDTYIAAVSKFPIGLWLDPPKA